MILLAIDPGTTESAYVRMDGDRLLGFGKLTNEALRGALLSTDILNYFDVCAIEMVASYGMPVGREVFETVLWIGRFVECLAFARRPHAFVYRQQVKLALCHSPRANDASIRQALIDRYGGKDKAIGRKANPGPLYGVKADCWSALAIAVTYADQQAAERAA